MRLFDPRRLPAFKVEPPPHDGGGNSLAVDDLLSRGSQSLGLMVDAEGKIQLVEDGDFD